MWFWALVRDRDFRQGVPVNRGIEGSGNLTLTGLMDHPGQVQAQLVQFRLAFPDPTGAPLVGIDMDGETHQPSRFQVFNQFRGQKGAISNDDGLPTLGGDVTDQVEQIRVHERLAAGDGNAVGAAHPFNALKFLDNRVQGPMIALFPIATLAIQVALGGGLQPSNGIVCHIPGETVIIFRSKQSSFHEPPPMRTNLFRRHYIIYLSWFPNFPQNNPDYNIRELPFTA